MKNALEVLAEMERWWHLSMPLGDARTPANAIKHGITYLYNESYGTYEKLQQESSKVAHVRALFTTWKAVVARMPSWSFYDPNLDAQGAFPAYIERFLPDMFVTLLDKNVFLGIKFSDADRQRHEQLRRNFTRGGAVVDKSIIRAGNQMLSRTQRRF